VNQESNSTLLPNFFIIQNLELVTAYKITKYQFLKRKKKNSFQPIIRIIDYLVNTKKIMKWLNVQDKIVLAG